MQNILVGQRYRLVEKIGSGGMADVYKAVDETLGRTVAVKLMHASLAHDPSFTARFQQEAKAAANLQSPYIVNIYDWGSETLSDGNQLYYIVMEYVRGEDLKSIIKRTGALPSGKVAEVGAMVCAALTTAHGYDIIHRDIKPHNIMVLPDGNIKVMDFGIARAGNTQMTQTGSVLGSAHYVSPEQAQGRDLQASSDLYSLGVVLYEAATGKLPFDGDSPVATALKQVQEQAVRPTNINPHIDPQLEQVIGFAMAKDPRARYSTADAMRRDLLRVARNEPIVGAHGNMDDDATRVMGGVVPLTGTQPNGQDADGTTVMPAVDAGTAAAQRGMGAPRSVDPEPKKKNKVWVWIAVIAALIAAAGIIAWQLGVFDQPDPEPTMVNMPDLRGITEESARELLRTEGVAVIVPDPDDNNSNGIIDDAVAILELPEANEALISLEEEYSPTVPEGYVIDTTPEADTELGDAYEAANTAIVLIISKGERTFDVPDLTGMTLQEAQTATAEADFVIEAVEENHDTVEAGRIISQNPDAGDKLPGGSTVRVVISAGVASVQVPDVRTMTRQQANDALTQLGLTATVREVFSSDVREGVVIDQNPRQGASLNRGTAVEITVSRGPEQVEVPSVLNMDEDAALNALNGAGLRWRVINAPGDFGRVIEQNPRPGQRVNPGATITITVGTGTDL